LSSVPQSLLNESGKHELVACQGPSGPETTEAKKHPNRKSSHPGNAPQNNYGNASCVERSNLLAGTTNFECLNGAFQSRKVLKRVPIASGVYWHCFTFFLKDVRSVDGERFYTATLFYRGGMKRIIVYVSRIFLTPAAKGLPIYICREIKLGVSDVTRIYSFIIFGFVLCESKKSRQAICVCSDHSFILDWCASRKQIATNCPWDLTGVLKFSHKNYSDLNIISFFCRVSRNWGQEFGKRLPLFYGKNYRRQCLTCFLREQIYCLWRG
jgi:hypothetical protein